uniref:Phospholipid scramblase n=1 Tax=Sphenodon punctatus TaxID=8508 RepID=A0A8D0L3N4_SPHPU
MRELTEMERSPGQGNYASAGAGFAPTAPPVQNQPTSPRGPAWMPAIPPLPNCPPGLEYLSQVDQLLIHQQTELLEIVTPFETNNKYEIKNSLGQRIYFAAEQSGFLMRQWGSSRSFTLRFFDNIGQEVMAVERPFNLLFSSLFQELEVQAPPGKPIGYVIQKSYNYAPEFAIQNEERIDILKLVGPCITCSCFEDTRFEVLNLDGSSLGCISKQWSGFAREVFTDADNFGIQFPLELEVKMKAVLLGACFLIVSPSL